MDLAEDRLHPIAEAILLELEHAELLPVCSGLCVFQLWGSLGGWLGLHPNPGEVRGLPVGRFLLRDRSHINPGAWRLGPQRKRRRPLGR